MYRNRGLVVSPKPMLRETVFQGIQKRDFLKAKLPQKAFVLFGRGMYAVKPYELLFRLEGPGSLRGGNPRKMGKNYKIPLPGLTPEIGENWPQKGVKLLQKNNFCNFSAICPQFQGSDRGRGIF